jgi:hypothetical protein
MNPCRPRTWPRVLEQSALSSLASVACVCLLRLPPLCPHHYGKAAGAADITMERCLGLLLRSCPSLAPTCARFSCLSGGGQHGRHGRPRCSRRSCHVWSRHPRRAAAPCRVFRLQTPCSTLEQSPPHHPTALTALVRTSSTAAIEGMGVGLTGGRSACSGARAGVALAKGRPDPEGRLQPVRTVARAQEVRGAAGHPWTEGWP